MIYLPKQKTKIYLLILCGLIFLHVSLVSTKSYTAIEPRWFKTINGSEEQYLSCLNSLSDIDEKAEFIKTTRIKYLFDLPEESLLLIYLGYFLIVSKFILSSKFELNESDHAIK